MPRVPRWFLRRVKISWACLGLVLLVLLNGCRIAAPPAVPAASLNPTASPVPPTAALLPPAERRQALQRTEQAVLDSSGYQFRPWLRPPFGDYGEQSLRDLAAIGCTKVLLWSCDTRDSLGATAEKILNPCIHNAQPGRIVLVYAGAQSQAYAALPAMIACLRDQGFTFVRADCIREP